MREIVIPLLIFFGGYYVRQLFDNRDLRRKILEPVFEQFEKHIVYLQTEWRQIQNENINQRDVREYVDRLNHGKDSLKKSRTDIVFACKKIDEEKLIPLVEEAFATLMAVMAEYSFFLDLRDDSAMNQRESLLRTLNEANEKFDKVLPGALDKVYIRYWELISSTLILERLRSRIKNTL